MAKIRLFVQNQTMAVGAKLLLEEKQVHYLVNVMKRSPGDGLLLFNGKDGEFEAKIVNISKKQVEVELSEKTKNQKNSEDIWLLFAPIKKEGTDMVIEKSTELGVGRIVPVITKNTITDKVRVERFRLQAIEAAEQSERLDVPEIGESVKLMDLLKNWDAARTLFYMDETHHGAPIARIFANQQAPLAILVGPEGGFAKEELDFLATLSYAKATSLGSLILRAETASIAALACWQALSGSWKAKGA